ncbi:RagB/SusD family nutrient uptake outer membrane protein [Pedobacter sp. N36a]|uniref:RagB/SusD family nutrient uptake outer membrane protein n=1 Tax=Pedobacter sp. N36a TaxID=2767996 RepID=UPI001656D004|nr:RagB/SusD family nutrient uptake outer membrane protein [Pedobacter sp. N36a]MBC8986855.1 RagB/SusD family nutrient uptake outer membrane protein [Pedobacter sp. N36a]
MNKIIKLSAVLLLMVSASSCKKYLDVQPVGKVIPTTVEDFRALLNSGYAQFPKHKSNLAFRTDELLMNNDEPSSAIFRDQYKWNDQNPDPNSREMPYGSFYTSIFYTNSVIADIEEKAGKSAATDQIKGEAYLLRAYNYFELLNLYAKPFNLATAASDRGVPISLAVDIETNYKPSSVEAVYTQIFADIESGRALMNTDNFAAGLNYRFTKRAALALTARVHEFRGEWANALKASQEALAMNSQLEDLTIVGAVSPNNYQSKENIMSMEDTFNADVSRSALMSPHLIGIYDQVNDKRFALYFGKAGGDYVSTKGNSNEFKISFRNGELYLIQAEAALKMGNSSLAQESLLALKAKRYTTAYFATEKTRVMALSNEDLMLDILKEREKELALEGHRWYDLKRYGQPELKHTVSGEVFTLLKNDPRYTIRFPQSAVQANPNLQ